jgi:hypothetical protein
MRMRPWLPCALAMTMLAPAVPAAHSQSVFDKLKQVGKKFTDAKIATHGINFDIAQSRAFAAAGRCREGAAGVDGDQRGPADDQGLRRREADCFQ